MRTLLSYAAAALVATGAVLAAGGATAQEFTLKFGYFIPDTSFTAKDVIIPVSEAIEKRSEGRIKINRFPGGGLGKDPRAQMQLMMDGISDITLIVPTYTPGEFPDNEIIELPLVIQTHEEASLSFSRLANKGLLRGYDRMKIISYYTTPAYNAHFNWDYKNIDDIKGKKIRVSTRTTTALAEAMGGTPVGNITVGEIAESLLRGVTDGTLLAWDSMGTYKVVPVTKHHVMVPMGYTPIIFAMNKSVWEKLPADLQKIIDEETGEKMSLMLTRVTGGAADRAIQSAKDAGNTLHYPEGADAERWTALLTPVVDQYRKENERGEELYQALVTELEQIRASKK